MKILHKKAKCSQPVIIKGFMGEPSRLDTINIENNFVTVVGISGKTQMKLNVKYAYQYDEGTYQKLCKAFDSGDTGILEKEWQCAKPIALS